LSKAVLGGDLIAMIAVAIWELLALNAAMLTLLIESGAPWLPLSH
jgi:hypothetical protein